MDGTTPLAVVDSGMTSNVRKKGNDLHLTGRPSLAKFKVSMGHKKRARKISTMEQKQCNSSHMFNMVHSVVLDLLLNTSKFSNAGYDTVFDKDKVNI